MSKEYKGYHYDTYAQEMGENGLSSDGKFEAIVSIHKHVGSTTLDKKFSSSKYFSSQNDALKYAERFAIKLIEDEKVGF